MLRNAFEDLATSAKQDDIIAAIQEAAPTVRIAEDSGDATIKYFGFAPAGTSEASTAWQIKRKDVSTGVTRFMYPSGDAGFNFAWDNRESESFS
jgi:hypothetical protein